MKAILTKYKGPTDRRGSRYIASDEDGNRITVPMDYALNSDGNHRAAAIALCEKMGWYGTLHSGGLGKNRVYVWADADDAYVIAKSKAA